jgi:phosphatidylglycerophosphate synthase
MSITTWDKYHCFALFVGSIMFLIWHSVLPFIIIGSISFAILWMTNWHTIKQIKPIGGLANLTTLIRSCGLLIFSVVYPNLSDLSTTIWLIMLVFMDGLDGYLARRRAEQTTFGEFFDKENDALFICVISCILLIKGMAGSFILIPGFLRYFYVVFLYLTGLQGRNEKRTKYGPAITVIMFLALSLSFILPGYLRIPLLIAATTLIVISFGYSFLILLNNNSRPLKEI